MDRTRRLACLATLAVVAGLAPVAFAEARWVDVRSEEEYREDGIPGDPNIPHEAAVEEVLRRFPDKSTELRLYCRSGRRAGLALDALKQAGYTKVSNAGGIEEVRKARGLTR